MMDWTDRHCRYFHRLLSQEVLLYTEMVTTGALLYGDVARHLDFHASEHPVALQLGGSEPSALARAAKLGAQWGYDEINLNCGCPSPRVQRGAFGACLMAEPLLVADSVRAMCDAISLPVTVKHRIGLDQGEEYSFVRDFVGTVAQAGCGVFIVHARNAVLLGLNPKENREIPPLKYDYAYRLKRDFPQLSIVVNGGVTAFDDILSHWQQLDGVMVGRHAYHQPYFLAQADNVIRDVRAACITREEVEEQFCAYMCEQLALGTSPNSMIRHMLGLYHGCAGARAWRRVLSDQRYLSAITQAKDMIALLKQARTHLGSPKERND